MVRTGVRCLLASLPAGGAAAVLAVAAHRLVAADALGALVALAVAGPALLVVYAAVAGRLGVGEVESALAGVAARLPRRRGNDA